MNTRRLTSLLLTLLLLNLTWAGGGLACTDDAHGDPADVPVAHEHAQHRMASTNGSTPEPSPEAPQVPRCCTSLTSCTITWNALREADQSGYATEAQVIAVNSLRVPAAGRGAPEPPPPKA